MSSSLELLRLTCQVPRKPAKAEGSSSSQPIRRRFPCRHTRNVMFSTRTLLAFLVATVPVSLGLLLQWQTLAGSPNIVSFYADERHQPMCGMLKTASLPAGHTASGTPAELVLPHSLLLGSVQTSLHALICSFCGPTSTGFAFDFIPSSPTIAGCRLSYEIKSLGAKHETCLMGLG